MTTTHHVGALKAGLALAMPTALVVALAPPPSALEPVSGGPNTAATSDDLPIDSLPTPSEDDLVRARLLSAGSKLRDKLEKREPATFGGMYTQRTAEGKSEVIYQLVEPSPKIEQEVFDTYRSITNDESLWPVVRFELVRHSLHDLRQFQGRIHNDQMALSEKGVYLTSTGIDDSKNSVVVAISPDAHGSSSGATGYPRPVLEYSEAANVIQQTYADGPSVEVRSMGEPVLQDRFGDVAPWNGGDLILSNTSAPSTCTTGFGMWKNVNGTLKSFVSTAGHCAADNLQYGNYAWKNAPLTLPINVTPTNTVGAIWMYNYGPDDYALIDSASSNIIWKGVSSRRYVLADRSPVYGDVVCREGAVTVWAGGGEQCGPIDAVNVVPWSLPFGGGSNPNYFYFQEAPGNRGDSGGPIVYPLQTGVLAVGSITAGFPAGSGDSQHHGVGESIVRIEMMSGAHLKTY